MAAMWIGTASNKNVENCVFWDNWGGIYLQGSLDSADHLTVNSNSTVTEDAGIPMGYGIGYYYGPAGSADVRNSIIYANPSYGLRPAGAAMTSDYNCVHGNGNDYRDVTPGNHDTSPDVNPVSGSPGNPIAALKYLLRIESGSDLKNAGSDNTDIGTTIVKCYGKSGTLWDEEGYNLLQDGTQNQVNANLWPFPHEQTIRNHMRDYSFGAISGNRGFCADNQTLTRYIWDYLGNGIPEEYAVNLQPPANPRIVE